MTKLQNLLFVLVIVSLFFTNIIPVSKCQETEELTKMEIDVDVNVTNVFLDNRTALFNILLVARNPPEGISSIGFLMNLNNSQRFIVCDRIGQTFQGTNEDVSSPFEGYGETFPIDVYFFEFSLYLNFIHYTSAENNNEDLFSNYTFENYNVQFSGLFESRLENEWNIFSAIQEDKFRVLFHRDSIVKSTQFMVPLFAILILSLFLVSFTNDSSLRTRIYSGILLFAPVFLFTIQEFIPSRNSLSFPELLGIDLILTSVIMIFVSVRDETKLDEKSLFYRDVLGIIVSLLFFAMFKQEVYKNISQVILSFMDSLFYITAFFFIFAILARIAVLPREYIDGAKQWFLNKCVEMFTKIKNYFSRVKL